MLNYSKVRLDTKQLCECLHDFSLHVRHSAKACVVLNCASLLLQDFMVISVITY